ncbi:DUF427 domain-containing protein [Sneathiella aquimaris]|uniref:DUF427 domain-containing protein n=1 Tax=Sneathiella aquimaris TaxID=2599305 RepID=UPI00146DC3C5|nr:DUF427 domain-containing protein [Sneathiella aquimaris]
MQSAPGFIKNPAHEIVISPSTKKWRVFFENQRIAATEKALELHESGCATRYYVPLSDCTQSFFVPSDHTTYCPFKGHARYWSLLVGGRKIKNAVWGYDDPFRECADLKGYVSFYTELEGLDLRAD